MHESNPPVWIPEELRHFGAIPRDADPAIFEILSVLRPVELLLAARDITRADTIARAGLESQRWGVAGELACALVAAASSDWVEVAERMNRVPRWLWLQLAPEIAIKAQVRAEPAVGLARLRALICDAPPEVAPGDWPGLLMLAVAYDDDSTRPATFRGIARIAAHDASSDEPSLELAQFARIVQPGGTVTPIEEQSACVPTLALIGYGHPVAGRGSHNLGDYIQTLALLAQVARLDRVHVTGSAEVVSVVQRLRSVIPEENRVAAVSGALRLVQLDRDASRFSDLPDGTWVIAHGWFMHPLAGDRYDFPFPESVHPVFLSFHCHSEDLLTGRVCDYLRANGPVGCRDLSTLQMLTARGVPAYFTGCLTSTLGVLGRRGSEPRSGLARVAVDVRPIPAGFDALTHLDPKLRTRSLGQGLEQALDRLLVYRDQTSDIVTSRLHCYLPARALGCDPRFVPDDPGDPRFSGLSALTDLAFETMGERLSDLCGQVFKEVVDGPRVP